MPSPPISPAVLLSSAIRPALAAMGPQFGGPDAEEMLLGIAAHESHCGEYLRQVGGGPALGIWQMEPAAHDDCWTNFLNYHEELAAVGRALSGVMDLVQPLASELETNPQYAAYMARVRLYRAKGALPPAGDLEAQAAYWKLNYNGPGKGTTDEYVANAHIYGGL